MANRSIFEFLLSSEVKQINVDSGVAMIYHGNWQTKAYKAGSVVRYNNGLTIDIYISNFDTSGEPSVSSHWEVLVTGVVIPREQMVDVNGLIMVDSNLDLLKVI